MTFATDPTDFAKAIQVFRGVDGALAAEYYVGTWIAETGACLDPARRSCNRTWWTQV
jgi:hypothetical protein